jgi:nucleoid-associated protein YgaU
MATTALARTGTAHVVAARHTRVASPAPISHDIGVRPAPTVAAYRRRRLVALFAAGATATLLTLAAPRAVAAFRDVPASVSERRPVPATYIVQPGDTLWSIALRLDPTGDPRTLVDELVQINGGSRLDVGQRLVIP